MRTVEGFGEVRRSPDPGGLKGHRDTEGPGRSEELDGAGEFRGGQGPRGPESAGADGAEALCRALTWLHISTRTARPLTGRASRSRAVQFAAVKATEGTYYRNPFALTDLAQAKAAGLSVMAYVFAIPNGNGGSASPVAQADYLISYLASAGGPLPPIMLDIEYNPYGAECYGLTQSAMVSWIAQFSAEIQAKTGQDPIIYGPVPWWHDCAGSTSRFAQFPLWVPYYTSAPRPAITPGWSNYGFWQYSSGGTVNGINAPGNTDLDRLNPAAIPLLDPGSQVSAAGGSVNLQLQLADPVAGQALSFSAAGLPPGVSMSATGWITGWPAGRKLPAHGERHRRQGARRLGFIPLDRESLANRRGDRAGPARLRRAVPGRRRVGECQPGPDRALSGSSAQGWTYASDGTLRIDNKCLTIPAAAQGAQVGLQPCASSAAQQWRLAYPKALNPALIGRPTTLVNPWSGMCLADPGFGTTGGTQVQLWPCDGSADQSWTLPAGPVTSQIPGMCVADTVTRRPTAPRSLSRSASGRQTRRGWPSRMGRCGSTGNALTYGPLRRPVAVRLTCDPATAPRHSGGTWYPTAPG